MARLSRAIIFIFRFENFSTDGGILRRMNNDDYLFVYGTLRRDVVRTDAGERAFVQLNTAASFVERASMDGRLFEVDGYPGGCYQFAVGSLVIGELYEVDDVAGLFAALDAYEECGSHVAEPHEYQRQRVPVALDSGSVVYAWVYLYNCSIDELPLIESGDYLLWQDEQEALLSWNKLDQTSRFSSHLFGRVLFWVVFLMIAALALFWFFGHTDFLSHIEQMEWYGVFEG
jgi:gamma-glutamylcyclotransferase (GGCT)/AIG2-like uncharacterized protein YtfP